VIYELRQYTLHPGRRETLIALFEREFLTGQHDAGMRVDGQFRDLADPDRFVWLRSFTDMAARAASLTAFYDGPVWKAHRDAANATMIDSDDVLLLRGTLHRPPPRPGTVYVVTLHAADTVEHPAVEPIGEPIGVLETENAENNFPRLPIRTGERLRVSIERFPDEPTARRLAPPEPDRLHLTPTTGSALH